jgi:hypothetical protein
MRAFALYFLGKKKEKKEEKMIVGRKQEDTLPDRRRTSQVARSDIIRQAQTRVKRKQFDLCVVAR